MRTLLELITIEMKEAFVKAGYGEELARVTLSNRPDLCEYQRTLWQIWQRVSALHRQRQ